MERWEVLNIPLFDLTKKEGRESVFNGLLFDLRGDDERGGNNRFPTMPLYISL